MTSHLNTDTIQPLAPNQTCLEAFMKLELHALALIFGLGLVAPAVAQEEPKKEEPKK